MTFALSLIQRQLPNDDRGIAGDDRICWHVPGNNGSRSHDPSLPHGDAAQNHRACPNPGIITNFDGLFVEKNFSRVTAGKDLFSLLVPLCRLERMGQSCQIY